MIEFSDLTLVESHGNFERTQEIMGVSDWMIRSTTLVSTESITASYLLHLWSNGKVVIMSTERPAIIEVPDNDVRELHNWCRDCGWSGLYVHKDLLEDQRGFEFWMLLFRAGLIFSKELERYEVSEMERFKASYETESLEEEDVI